MDFFVEGKPHATIEDYEKAKDKGITSIGKEENKKLSVMELRLIELKQKLGKLKFPIDSKDEFSKKLGIGRTTLQNWGYEGFFRGVSKFQDRINHDNITLGEKEGGEEEDEQS
jgi:hypothetical protein